MAIAVTNGVNTLEAEVTGRTVAELRKMTQQALNIDPTAFPMVDGQTVGEDYTLQADDHDLEFVKAGGRKGAFVATIGGALKVLIFPKEHSRPHFHVDRAGESVRFNIADGLRFPGDKGLRRHDREIRRWCQKNQRLLYEQWNRLRPTNCPVGPIRE